MGEIADALRRAREERSDSDSRHRPTPDIDPASVRAPAAPLAQTPATADAPASVRARAASLASPTRSGSQQPDELAGAAKPDAERLVIPRGKDGSWIPRMVVVQKGGGAEAYRHFGLRVRRELDALGHRSVMIVSALREEGKTTTACNLALALASMAGGRKTALVDLDLRRPSIGNSFDIQPPLGIESVLYGNSSLEEVCVPTDLLSLDLFPVGAVVHSPHELLAGPPLDQLMRSLHAAYDVVVVDSPPLLLVPDTSLILPHIGGCVAVLRSRRTKRNSFTQMLGMLPPQRLIGTLLNDAHMPRHTKQYGYYLHEDEQLNTEPV